MKRHNTLIAGTTAAVLVAGVAAGCSSASSPERPAAQTSSAEKPTCAPDTIRAIGKQILSARQSLQPSSNVRVWSGADSFSVGIDIRGKNTQGQYEDLQVIAQSAQAANSAGNLYDPCSTDQITATLTLTNPNGTPSSPFTSYYVGVDTGYNHMYGAYAWQPTPEPNASPNGEASCGSELDTHDPAIVAKTITDLRLVAQTLPALPSASAFACS